MGDRVQVNSRAYLRLDAGPERVKPTLDIEVAAHAYLPKADDLEGDWVASVAVPAFKRLRLRRGHPFGAFCSIGTGSGLDALAAVETLGASRVGVTDLDAEVVRVAADNIRRNRLPSHPLDIEAGHGDLLEPLRPSGARYDIVYENLPNIPVADAGSVAEGRNSGAHLAPRREAVPDAIRRQMLDLHYLALVQARDFLLPGGAVLSMLGARMPLEVYLRMGEAAGYESSILSYSWKVQAEPEEVLPGHVRTQREGHGPFHFYRAAVLREAFREAGPLDGAGRAFELERALEAERLSPAAALAAWESGEVVGHTVAVLHSTLGRNAV